MLRTFILLPITLAAHVAAGQSPVVEIEETVYEITSPGNGAGPMWSYGCTVIARAGDDVYVSQMETGEEVEPLCNTRWRLLRREDEGWKCVAEARRYRQREPCPIALTGGDTLNLYVNDSLTDPGTHYKACKPYVLRFGVDGDVPQLGTAQPQWNETTTFTDHSYRGYAADGEARELLMLNIDAKTSKQHWVLIDDHNVTQANGAIEFPIRAAYPQVALKNGAAHVLAIGDIVEPNEKWREYKREQTGRKWDYVFRRLFYAYAKNLKHDGFAAPIEIANVDATAGFIRNQDLWLRNDGAAYALYTERETQSALLRDKFFPEASLLDSLKLAVIKENGMVARHTLAEGSPERQVSWARFHETPDGRCYIFAYITGANPRNELLALDAEGRVKETTIVPFEKPFTAFVLAMPRAGNAPSKLIDILGHQGDGSKLAYGRVRLAG